MNLFLILVPPKKLIVKNENDEQISGLIGPIEEGSKLKLKCLAKGGKQIDYLINEQNCIKSQKIW